jgi:hypothetical protein
MSETCKVKAVTLEAWSGPRGFQEVKVPRLHGKAQDGGKFVRYRHRPPLPLGNARGTHFC